ncbi:NAD-specific glutamate dehydrogenase [compost metagenome]
MDQVVGLVTGLHQLFELTVSFGVHFSITHHFLDFFFVQTRRSLDGDLLLTAGILVFGRHVQNTVGVDVEGHFDLRHTAWSRLDAVQIELAQ